MSDRIQIGREAMRRALELRRQLSIPREAPVNVFDLANSIGVEVRFMDLSSLEGMFLREPHPVIVLPSLNHRSRGRVSYTCGHELGHFQLGHGTRVDEYVADPERHSLKSDDEVAADVFASSLLMPRPAVLRCFESRGWNPTTALPWQLFAVAGELDVGYTTLLKHMRFGLQLTDAAWLRERERRTPKELRTEITGDEDVRRVILLDLRWSTEVVDLETGDYLALPLDAPINPAGCIEEVGTHGPWRLFAAKRIGRTVTVHEAGSREGVARW